MTASAEIAAWDVVYARLAPLSRTGWLRLLAEGWQFSDPNAPAPIVGPHSQYSVLMLRRVRTAPDAEGPERGRVRRASGSGAAPSVPAG